MKAIVTSNSANIGTPRRVPVMSYNPKTQREVNEGNWRREITYTRYKKGDVVEVDDITFRNLVKKGVLKEYEEPAQGQPQNQGNQQRR